MDKVVSTMASSAREVRYLASRYSVSTELVNRCAKMVAKDYGETPYAIVDIIYEAGSKISKLCEASDIGGRPTNEDAHVFQDLYINKLGHVTIAGVFDGHGGSEISNILAKELGGYLVKELNSKLKSDNPQVVSQMLVQAFSHFDDLLRAKKVRSGSTMTLVLITKDKIYSANLGDSRTLIFTPDENILLETKDHKPSDPTEKERIIAAGGNVINVWSVERVNGNLSLSRAFGDFGITEKPLGSTYYISNVADVSYIERNQPVYILLACDGIWDVFNSKDLVGMVSQAYNCNAIIKSAYNRGSRDNMTVMLLKA